MIFNIKQIINDVRYKCTRIKKVNQKLNANILNSIQIPTNKYSYKLNITVVRSLFPTKFMLYLIMYSFIA